VRARCFGRRPLPANVDGQIFALFVIALAAAEAAVGLALIISIYRNRQSVQLDDFNLMQG
jgi:NADH:ubiquinone oxidoreductase subunit K